MLGHVVERLLGDPVQDRLDLLGQAHLRPRPTSTAIPVSCSNRVACSPHGLVEAAVVEHGRPQGAHQAAQHPHLLAEALLDPLQHLVGALKVPDQGLVADLAGQVGQPLAGPVDVVVEDGQLLHRPVVEVVGDPGALVLGRLEHPAEQAAALVLHGDLAGEPGGPGHDQQEHDDAAGGHHRHLRSAAPASIPAAGRRARTAAAAGGARRQRDRLAGPPVGWGTATSAIEGCSAAAPQASANRQ